MLPLLLAFAVAPAEPASWLTWRGPARCDESEILEHIVASYVEPAKLEELVVHVELAPSGDDALHGDVSIVGRHGSTRRSIDAPDCRALVDAIALIVVIHADPLSFRLGEPAPDREPPTPTSTPPLQHPANRPRPATKPALEPAPERTLAEPGFENPGPPEATVSGSSVALRRDQARRAEGHTGGLLRADAVAGWGRLPRADLGIALAVGVTRPRWRLEASALYLAPRNTTPEADGLSAQVSWVGARALVCPVLWQRAAWAVPLCVGVEAGGMRGRGRGGAINRSDWAPWAAGVLGPRLHWRQPGRRLGVWVGADAAAAFARPQFAFSGADPVYESAPATVQASVGLELHLPVTDPDVRRQGGSE